jgi:hypothetical protein
VITAASRVAGLAGVPAAGLRYVQVGKQGRSVPQCTFTVNLTRRSSVSHIHQPRGEEKRAHALGLRQTALFSCGNGRCCS